MALRQRPEQGLLSWPITREPSQRLRTGLWLFQPRKSLLFPLNRALPETLRRLIFHIQAQRGVRTWPLQPWFLWTAVTAFSPRFCLYWDDDCMLHSCWWPLPSLGVCRPRYHPESEWMNWICMLFFKYCPEK